MRRKRVTHQRQTTTRGAHLSYFVRYPTWQPSCGVWLGVSTSIEPQEWGGSGSLQAPSPGQGAKDGLAGGLGVTLPRVGVPPPRPSTDSSLLHPEGWGQPKKSSPPAPSVTPRAPTASLPGWRADIFGGGVARLQHPPAAVCWASPQYGDPFVALCVVVASTTASRCHPALAPASPGLSTPGLTKVLESCYGGRGYMPAGAPASARVNAFGQGEEEKGGGVDLQTVIQR